MIQRKQTLFLFLSGFLNVILLSIASNKLTLTTGSLDVALVPLRVTGVSSTAGHLAAIYLNFSILVLAAVTVFLYQKRELQIKLCYGAAILWLCLSAMIAFCPFVLPGDPVLSVAINYLSCGVALGGALAVITAARFIKKDIELLKSADRIR